MQTYEELLSQVIEMIQPLAPQGRSVREDTDLVSDLEFDSLKVMSLVERVEDRFDISDPAQHPAGRPHRPGFHRSAPDTVSETV